MRDVHAYTWTVSFLVGRIRSRDEEEAKVSSWKRQSKLSSG